MRDIYERDQIYEKIQNQGVQNLKKMEWSQNVKSLN
jgi:hypothetical protein